MVMVKSTFLMVVHIVDILEVELQKDMEDYYILMVIFILDNGRMINHMEKEVITLLMEQNIKDIGN